MSQPPQDKSAQDAPQETAPDFEEFYVEPPRMGRGDIAGVIGALLALAIIGLAGYVWLNPELDFGDLRARLAGGGGVQPPSDGRQAAALNGDGGMGGEKAGAATGDGEQDGDKSVAATGMDADGGQKADATGMDMGDGDGKSAATVEGKERPRCASCGMFTDQTLGAVQAVWSDGSRTSHDCWTCAMDYSREHGLSLASAKVLDYSAGLAGRKELDAKGAWFLYDTTAKIDGSMPPYTAAFAGKAAAEAAQADMGGELADFAALMEKLSSAGGEQP